MILVRKRVAIRKETLQMGGEGTEDGARVVRNRYVGNVRGSFICGSHHSYITFLVVV